MKVCFCIGKLSYSGAENVVRFLAESLIEKKYDVSAVFLERMPTAEDNVFGLTSESAIVNGSGILNAIRRVKSIRRALKKIKPDVFIIFNYVMAFTGVPATFGIRNLKVIACERNDPVSVPSSKKRRRLRDFMFHRADACVSQTEEIAEYFRKINKRNYVVFNPVREQTEMCPPVSEREKVFVTVARLDDGQKNQSMMIRAFSKIVPDYPEYSLHFLGDGSDRKKYEDLVENLNIRENVKFLGKVEKPLEYIKNCRSFLLTSEFEGMPNALLEAMSVGLPCISTDCLGGGAKALINNGENGILIDRNDEMQLIKEMKKIIEDDTLCDRIGREAYKVNTIFQGSRILSMWENVINDICKER